ncbi:PD-(D/E)XK nuclease family protein [Wolbachia endosymbiont of Ctenocephalides felis wCfeT]|uniref:PD-(D/E)XK nuclease family protein n=1 Tax=Wolbachia endosymbiont of Ctenocephalides felis wCfeT TaxID=2732593 RepID=UPI001582A192|nr:PD-(D/E)XK nuclease family protein [Wolbachia endosymbiont of Ctenocephalides felis wCfeT]
MGRIFTINVNESFFDELVQYILSEYEKEKISELKIILPCKRDVIALLNAFKNCRAEKCIMLPEIISLENIDEEDLILNIDRVKVINPKKKILLLMQFILEWNKQNNDNFPIDLAYSLPALLDKIQYNDNYLIGNKYSQKIENFVNLLIKTCSKALSNLGVVDILEHKRNYINDMILSLKKDQQIIFVGIGKDEIYKSLIKAIYDLPLGIIILTNLNLDIEEKDWQLLDKKHYQYCLKSLLDYLSIERKDVVCLNAKEEKIIDYIFDTTADLSKINSGQDCNIEVITCDSEEEEAQVTSLIIENESYEKVSLVVINKLLAARIACLSGQHTEDITLLTYTIEVLISNWNSVALLSLLKHRLVNFGYAKEEYRQILSEFEIEILRNFNTIGLKDIIRAIDGHKQLKYKDDILEIIKKLDKIFNLLLKCINCNIAEVTAAHLQCINMLYGVNFLELDSEIGDFICNFSNACEGITIKCSLELYSKILTLFLERDFFSATNDLNRFSLYHNKVVILTGFNVGSYPPNFQNPFLIRELSAIQEEQGYFLYNLHNLFCASKVYITRSSNQRKPILLQRLEVLLNENRLLSKPIYGEKFLGEAQASTTEYLDVFEERSSASTTKLPLEIELRKKSDVSKQPYREWLRMLNTPECVVPCTQPMPKPNAEVRREKMQVISCSAVEKLIRNPYSFYVEYILGLKQLKDLNFKPSILEFGTMVHDILAHNEKSLMTIAQKEFSSGRFNFSNMWWVRLEKIIQSFLQLTETRSKHFELEKSFSYPVLQEVLLTARCDRVEHLSDNQLAIIDYKLGSPPSNEEVMSGFFPQLILQALTVEHITKKQISELAYWKLDYDKIKVVSLQNYREKMQEFQNDLPDFLSNYLKDTTPFVASPYFDKFMRFNSYKQLERMGKW